MGALVVAVIVTIWVIPISLLVNRIVPEPYMDEIFHIPQAQQYCSGNFKSWDPMITTPPGLYCLSLAHVATLFPGMYFVKAVSLVSQLCSTTILRSTNGVLSVLCSIFIYKITTCLNPSLGQRKATLHAVVLSLYPLHWFFTFLYYTDVASLTAVLAMYLACLRKNYHLSALIGALAAFIRQTNIIWVLFVACTGVIDLTIGREREKVKKEESLESIRESSQSTTRKRTIPSSNLKRRTSSTSSVVVTDNISSTRTPVPTPCLSGFLSEIQTIIFKSWRMKWVLLVSFTPFFILLVAFVTFVYWNGSIVLGAKDAHAVSPHVAQVMYYGLVAALASAPLHFSIAQIANLFKSFWENKPTSIYQWLVALLAGFLSVHFFSIAHPYLLADNRHYPFYLWRKVINAHWLMKYLLVPLYTYSWFSIFTQLGKARPKIWVVTYFFATAAVMIPAPLVEFRYYTIPFYLLMLNSPISDDNISWLAIAILYLAINLFTMFMFLFRPFHWDHEAGVQRFVW